MPKRILAGMSIQKRLSASLEATLNISKQTREYKEELSETKAALDAAKPSVDQLLGAMDRNVGSPIASFIEDIEWFQAGGWRIQFAFEEIKRAWIEDKLTDEQAKNITWCSCYICQ